MKKTNPSSRLRIKPKQKGIDVKIEREGGPKKPVAMAQNLSKTCPTNKWPKLPRKSSKRMAQTGEKGPDRRPKIGPREPIKSIQQGPKEGPNKAQRKHLNPPNNRPKKVQKSPNEKEQISPTKTDERGPKKIPAKYNPIRK